MPSTPQTPTHSSRPMSVVNSPSEASNTSRMHIDSPATEIIHPKFFQPSEVSFGFDLYIVNSLHYYAAL